MKVLFFVLLTLVSPALLMSAITGEREVGLKIGDTIPQFTLMDQDGQERDIKDLVGRNGALLDFYRSADW